MLLGSCQAFNIAFILQRNENTSAQLLVTCFNCTVALCHWLRVISGQERPATAGGSAARPAESSPTAFPLRPQPDGSACGRRGAERSAAEVVGFRPRVSRSSRSAPPRLQPRTPGPGCPDSRRARGELCPLRRSLRVFCCRWQTLCKFGVKKKKGLKIKKMTAPLHPLLVRSPHRSPRRSL